MTEIKNENNGVVRNILLIGKTGNGKSTLANVLVNDNKKFKESSSTTSTTKKTQVEEFAMKINDKEVIYRVIDTIGIGDTQLTPQEVLNRVAEACHEIRNGLSQIFFVTKDRFTEEELEAYNLLRKVLFDEEITKYTTIVRTGFSDFEDEEKCKEDKMKMDKENTTLAEVIRNCNDIIYVENPPIPEKGRASTITSAKELREESRKRLLDHLIYKCADYKPIGINKLGERIDSYMTEKEQLQKRLEELEKARKEEKLKTEKEKQKYEEEKQKNQNKLTELEARIEKQAKELLN